MKNGFTERKSGKKTPGFYIQAEDGSMFLATLVGGVVVVEAISTFATGHRTFHVKTEPRCVGALPANS